MILTKPTVLLRGEGAAMLVAALWLYHHAEGGWFLLVLLAMAPDLAMIGYLGGPRTGAALYNAAHAALLPLALVAAGVLLGHNGLNTIGFVWLAHIGLDRMLGYGLKVPTGFGDTHLHRKGHTQVSYETQPI
jgi:hypothetical protein